MTNPKPTPLDIVAIRRHILSQLGIGGWVGKNSTSTKMTWHCRFGVPAKNGMPLAGNLPKLVDAVPNQDADFQNTDIESTDLKSKDIKSKGIESNSLDGLSPTTPKQTAHLPQSPVSHPAPSTIKQASDKPSVAEQSALKPIRLKIAKSLRGIQVVGKIQLSAIRYKNLLLLADDYYLDDSSKTTYDKLESYLIKQDSNTQTQMISPVKIDDDDEQFTDHSSLICQLFLHQLCQDKPIELVLLTPLSPTIDLGELLNHQVQGLVHEQILNNYHAKQVFWQWLSRYQKGDLNDDG